MAKWALLSVVCLFALGCGRGTAKLDPHVEKLARQTGTAFATALTEGRFEAAHALLNGSLQKQFTASALHASYQAMIAYGNGPAQIDGPVQYDAMAGWPTRGERDLGWVYVSLAGTDYLEAVTVVVASEHGQPKIRLLEWGRP